MAFTESLVDFFDVDQGFAVSATWNGTTVDGIFDDGHVPVDAGGAVRFESTQPMFLCPAADVAAAAHGQGIVINGVTYTIAGIHPDGTGLVSLALEAP